MHSHTLAVAAAALLCVATIADAQTPPTAASPAAPAAAAPTTTPPAAAPAPAPGPMARIRGTIASVTPHLLTITSRDGTRLQVSLTEPLTVSTMKRVALASIKDNAYLGVASRPGPHGSQVALEVLVFPDAMRGVAAGHYAWDLRPDSMMTNAPVTGVATAKTGRDLTLSYQGGSVVIHVPPRTPVVTFAPAAFADLKPGRKVFIVAHRDADGHLATARVTVGTHGVNPPM